MDTAMVEVFDTAGALVASGTATGIVAGPFSPTGTEVAIYTKNAKAAIDNFEAKPLVKLTLTGTPDSLSVAAGGVQALDISMGPAHALDFFLMLGSTSGTTPTLPPIDGVTIPLNADAYFMYTLTHPTSQPLTGAAGSLDALGQRSVTFTLPPAFDPGLVGMTIHHSAVTFTIGGTAVVTGATDPAPLTLTL
jgi:hypothetical protein